MHGNLNEINLWRLMIRHFDEYIDIATDAGVMTIQMAEPALLEFEHVIEINHPEKPREWISRESLWQGLVYRARYPDYFSQGLQSEIESEHDQGFVRIIKAGSMQLRDEVTLSVEQTEIQTLIDGRTEAMHAESKTAIEESGNNMLQVRFFYRRSGLPNVSGVDAESVLKSAYVQNDQAAIETIRQMILDGWSETPS